MLEVFFGRKEFYRNLTKKIHRKKSIEIADGATIIPLLYSIIAESCEGERQPRRDGLRRPART
jgi:hypothetical protein